MSETKRYTATQRVLNLIRYLKAHGPSPIRQTAADLQLSVRQLRDTVTTAAAITWGRGDPLASIHIGIDDEDDGVILLLEDQNLGIVLSVDQQSCRSLLLALMIYAEGAADDELATTERAIAKLAQMGRIDQLPTLAFSDDAAEQTRKDVVHAKTEKRQIRMTYVNGRGEVTTRRVDPYHVSNEDGYLYLTAWCHLKNGWRQFRVDRMSDVVVLDEAIESHPEPDPDMATLNLAITVTPDSAYLGDEREVESVTEDEQGRPVLHVSAFTHDWAVSYVCSLGRAVVAVSPTSVAEAVARRAESALAADR
ncbi:MAG: WYL domain-containing protein [Actinomycetaceae bacterium]|nr:WYL domain-containing protein [Actinomycetaceae bacterium]MDU0969502.1 WYL domain-containing protein [Actinomycetaceae bacterium]